MFCDNLEGWEGGIKREGTCVYLWLIHVDLFAYMLAYMDFFLYFCARLRLVYENSDYRIRKDGADDSLCGQGARA